MDSVYERRGWSGSWSSLPLPSDALMIKSERTLQDLRIR
jgi:hypothetical protein